MERRCGETPPVPSNGEKVTTKLQRIVEKARSDPKLRFTSLFHLMDGELLRGCFASLRGDAAACIDQVTKEANGSESVRSGGSVAPDGLSSATSTTGIHSQAGQ